jgi:carbonic anhydrase
MLRLDLENSDIVLNRRTEEQLKRIKEHDLGKKLSVAGKGVDVQRLVYKLQEGSLTSHISHGQHNEKNYEQLRRSLNLF